MTQNGDRVSLHKASVPGAPATQQAPRPPQVRWIVIALLISGVASVAASLSLYGLHHFLVVQGKAANPKQGAKGHQTAAELAHTASVQPMVSVIQSVIFLVVLLFVARAVWKGRYWARWAVIGLWVLASFARVNGGLLQITALFANAPVALTVPIFISSASFVVAVALMVFVKPVVTWLNLTRPVRPGAAPVAPRRGLFAPREPVERPGASAREATPTADTRAGATSDRPRTKQRVSADSAQRGADAARARAKASKSRRTPQ